MQTEKFWGTIWSIHQMVTHTHTGHYSHNADWKGCSHLQACFKSLALCFLCNWFILLPIYLIAEYPDLLLSVLHASSHFFHPLQSIAVHNSCLLPCRLMTGHPQLFCLCITGCFNENIHVTLVVYLELLSLPLFQIKTKCFKNVKYSFCHLRWEFF